MRRREFLTAALAGATAAPLVLRPRAADAAPPAFARFDRDARALLGRMTLAEKLGQMTQAELGQLRDEADVERYFLGSVLSGGGADPPAGNGLEAWTDAVDRLITRSLATRLAIPILYGADAVHGHSNVEGAVIFPHNVGLGCTRDAKLVEAAARVTAAEMRATGIRWTFAPCIAVPRDERWGRTYEGFGEDPALVSSLGAAAVRGFQGRRLDASPHAVLACAKHYVGDGGTAFAPRTAGDRTVLLDQGDTRVDEATLRRIHLPGYAAAVAAGVGSIMVSFSSWNGAKLSGNRHLLTEVLKEELGFDGFLVSDYYAIEQLDADYKTAVMHAINAGLDMAMEPARYATFIGALGELVGEGRVPIARIDDAVLRILRVKAAMGLLDPRRPQLADRSLHARFGSAEHRAVARRAVRESLVLLKNDGVLPLEQNARFHVAGRAADDIGLQCGGWTVSWQGAPGAVTSGGTTLLAALRAAAGPSATIAYSPDAALAARAAQADVAIVVVAEPPYAEGVGDRRDLALAADDRALLDAVAATGVPVVLVLYSGRPLILGDALDRAAAVVAAWLPGTEGAGIADVLLGAQRPTGKLGMSWPQSMAQIPINVGDADYAPLFPYGYGLTYS